MSLFRCPTHGLHQGPVCPAGNEIDRCAGQSEHVTLEPPAATLEEQWTKWEQFPHAHGPEFDAKWDELNR